MMYIHQSEEKLPGHLASTHRLTVIIGSNATDDFKV